MTTAPLTELDCEECGAERIRTESGYCCPNGHGRIRTISSGKAHKIISHRKFMKLPACHQVAKPDRKERKPGIWSVEGKEGCWRLSHNQFDDRYAGLEIDVCRDGDLRRVLARTGI